MALADFRLTLISAATWLGIVLGIAFPSLTWWLVCLGAVLVVGSLLRRSRRLAGTVLVLVGLGLLGSVSVAIHYPLRYPPILHEGIPDSTPLTVVVEKPAPAGASTLWGRIRAVSGRGVWPTPVLVTGAEITQRVVPGTTLTVTGTLERREGLDARAWLLGADSLQVTGDPHPFLLAADQLRGEFTARSLALGGDGGALLPGLALGHTDAVSASLEYDMRRAGLAHLVAVSGANCAIVVALALGAVALLGGGVWIRLVVGVVALLGFVILVTPEPSVVRAAVMATAVLCAGALGRPAVGIQVLSVTVCLLLLLDPWRGVEISFGLSVAATAGIIAGFSPVSRLLQRFLPAPLALVLALPLAAHLAVTPLLILLRPSIPTYGLIANALVAPLAPVVTVLGLLGCLLGPWAPAFANAMAWVAWWPASAIAALSRGIGQMPLGEIPWLDGLSGVAAASAASAGVWALTSARYRRLGAGGIALVLLWVSTQTLLPSFIASAQRPRNWQVAQCDVGQGDALLVNTAEGVVAIDTGDDEALLRECLNLMAVSRVRLLILSHFDTDHVGQSLVFRGITEEVWSGQPENAEDWRRMRDLEASGARWRVVAEGETLSLGQTFLRVLWPTSQPLAAPGNDSSVTVLIDFQGSRGPVMRLLALGDLGEQSQHMLLGRLPGGPIDVVKVSHHGSADQSLDLYDQLHATIGLIGVGADNNYGHPTAETLEILSTTQTQVLRTDLHGTVVLGTGEEGLWAWSSGGR